jgi:hypothetical protein
VGRSEGKRRLGRSRRRWVDNIKMYLTEIGWGAMDQIDLTVDRDGNEFSVSVKCSKILEQLSNWRLLKMSPAPRC